jgi:hypothetical protein
MLPSSEGCQVAQLERGDCCASKKAFHAVLPPVLFRGDAMATTNGLTINPLSAVSTAFERVNIANKFCGCQLASGCSAFDEPSSYSRVIRYWSAKPKTAAAN